MQGRSGDMGQEQLSSSRCLCKTQLVLGDFSFCLFFLQIFGNALVGLTSPNALAGWDEPEMSQWLPCAMLMLSCGALGGWVLQSWSKILLCFFFNYKTDFSMKTQVAGWCWAVCGAGPVWRLFVQMLNTRAAPSLVGDPCQNARFWAKATGQHAWPCPAAAELYPAGL